MSVRLVIFDVGGVLRPSRPFLDDARIGTIVTRTVALLGLPADHTRDARPAIRDCLQQCRESYSNRDQPLQRSVQPRVAQLLADLGVEPTDRRIAALIALLSEIEDGPLSGHAVRAVRQIRCMGVDCALVANSVFPPIAMCRTLDRTFSRSFFRHRVWSGSGYERKPSPVMLLETLQVTGCPASEAMYVGNKECDARAARSADMLSVILVGPHTRYHDGEWQGCRCVLIRSLDALADRIRAGKAVAAMP